MKESDALDMATDASLLLGLSCDYNFEYGRQAKIERKQDGTIVITFQCKSGNARHKLINEWLNNEPQN